MNYTAEYIANELGADASILNFPKLAIRDIAIDSRIISNGQDTLFAALKSDQNDGHRFIADAFNKGVRTFLVADFQGIDFSEKANFIIVEDPLAALQLFAKKHQSKFDLPVIGITGSNGKTIVKEWISFLLSDKYFVHKSPGSFNSQIGVPLSIFPINDHHEYAVLEAGISEVNEMEKLAKIIQCDIGVFTYLGSAHDSGFKDREEKMLEKAKLFTKSSTLIFPEDDPIVSKVLTTFEGKKLGWSRINRKAFCHIISSEDKVDGTQLSIMLDGIPRSIWIPFQSKALVENALSAVITAYYCNIPFENIASIVGRLPEVDMRLMLSKGINNSTLIHDYYNADLHGLEVALDFMNVHANQRKKILVLSELNQVATSDNDFNKIIKSAKTNKRFDQFIGIGKRWKKIIHSANNDEFFTYDNSEEFLSQFNFSEFKDSIILLKGSRRFQFEKLSQQLRFQSHSAELSINLSTLKSNLDFFRRQLSSETQLMVMVKASAYGSGSAEVSKMLAYNQVDALCVAYMDEGIELRRQGIELPIMVLNADPTGFHTMAQYNLEPEIYKIQQLEQLIEMKTPPAIHLKLDTGMNRLGFKAIELPAIMAFLQNSKLTVRSIFSHLAATDDPNHDAFTNQQVHEFINLANQLDQQLGYRPKRHILNTLGILRFPQYHFDQVRLGIGLYGIGVGKPWSSQIASIFSLTASISQIKTIQPGESIGYGRNMKATKLMKIATVNIGYADGLLRKAGNGRFSLKVNGQMAPTVGNICMDMCMIDITAIDQVKTGQRVEIFSDSDSIDTLAASLDTIPYEVLTNISARIPRIYLRD